MLITPQLARLARLRCLWFVALPLLVGCGGGSELDRAVVSGTVSYQGQPVEEGLIRFVPIKGTKGPPAGSMIKDGHYEIKAIGGVPTGVCRVEIKGIRSLGPPKGQPAGPPPLVRDRQEQYIPVKYNRQSILEVTINQEGGQIQNFDLK